VFYAPADVRLSPHDIVQPDLFFVRHERLHLIHEQVYEGAPDLVIEILSPSTRVYDEVRKADLYASTGVPELWFADSDERDIRAYKLVGNRYEPIAVEGTTVRSVVLPGFAIDVAKLYTYLG
jgi:Uma2 family endonuclease